MEDKKQGFLIIFKNVSSKAMNVTFAKIFFNLKLVK